MAPTAKRDVLFIVSELLGNGAYSRFILNAVQEIPEITPHVISWGAPDYATYKPARIARFSESFSASEMMRQKLEGFLDTCPVKQFDALFLQSFELMPFLHPYIAKYPAIVACDGTSTAAHDLVARKRIVEGGFSLRERIVKRVKGAITTPWYRRTANRVDLFMPWTRWCANSLRNDFGVAESRMMIAPSGLDMNVWKPNLARRTATKRLLFVGNEFERKGGPFLLRAFTQHIHPAAELHIVSNDASLREELLPAGVTLHRGLGVRDKTALVALYQSADVFVFPTQLDRMGLVLAEAAATGAPIVATDVGGVSQICRPDENGSLVPLAASEHTFAEQVLRILGDDALAARYSRRGRQIAEQELSHEAMARTVRSAFDRLFQQ